MRLDLSAGGRLRMPVNAIGELDAWLARIELPFPPGDVGALLVPYRSEEGGWVCEVEHLGMPKGRGKNRRREVEFVSTFTIEEFPPRCVWRYMKLIEEEQ